MRLTVQHGAKAHALELGDDPTPDDLRAALMEASGVLPRHQKLVFKGKVLPGANPSRATPASLLAPPVTLASLGIGDGAKLMLLAQQGGDGGHVAATAGTAALAAKRAADAAATAAKRAATAATAGGGSGGGGQDWAARASVWAKTGVISLRDAGLTDLPEALYGAAAGAATAADLGGNPALTSLPPRLCAAAAPRLARLRLTGTGLPTLPPSIGSLTRLETLLLDRCRLAGPLPAELWALPALKRLSLARNPGLGSLQAAPPPSPPPPPPPPSPSPPFSWPPTLEVLDVSHCGLAALPAGLGAACPRLALVDARSNRIGPTIPADLGRVPALRLDGNRIASLPAGFFDAPGAAIALLSLHANPVTAEALREAPGWAAYDERRRAAVSKRLAGRAVTAPGGGTAFDEGADAVEWMSYGGS